MDHVPKRIRAEIRTNCKVRMTISLDRVAKNYEVTDIVVGHNHHLQLPQTCHLMASQRKISELQAFEILLDYAHFGDVVTFDTTFGTNKEYRPFGIFLGLNQFRETTIFGAALLFDETCDSFKWLFETFLAAHNGNNLELFIQINMQQWVKP
jgi:hypothetical protein